MDLFAHPVIAIVLLLGILVIVHEAGHFLVGKFFKIPVEVFSIGFGPTLLSVRRGETDYRLSAIPLGGYVKFYGSLPSEDVPEVIRGREYYRASLHARFLTIAAGPLANILLAIVVFAAMVMYGIRLPPAVIGEMSPGSPAARAGLQFGDQIVSIDGQEVRSWKDVQRFIGDAPERNIELAVRRGGETVALRLAPEAVEDEDLPGTRGRIGISRVMVPAILSHLRDAGFMAEAGLATGDRIQQVAWDGQQRDIRYWQTFIRWLGEISPVTAQRTEPLDVRFKVQTYEPTEAGPKLGKERWVSVRFPAGWTYQAERLAVDTGVQNAELTIYRTEEPLEGIEKGDTILAWNGQAVGTALELHEKMRAHKTPEVKLTVQRAGQSLDVTVKLRGVEVQRAEGKAMVYVLPALFWGGPEEPEWIVDRRPHPLEALAYGWDETVAMTKSIAGAIGGLFTGEMPLASLGGPIAIAKVASDSVRVGWQAFSHALALISINLALINLVPIPVLDGGQLVLVTTEAVLRRRVRETTIENYQKIGFLMVLALFVIATYNDLGRFWASMLRGVGSMF